MSTRPFLGINVNPASVDELRYRGLVEEGETLLALFDGVLLDEHRRRVGGLALSDFVALTDRRVVIWARGFFNDTVDSFAWQDVDVVQAETWDPWHGRVQLAFRLPPVAPRTRRIAVNGSGEESGSGERLVVNTLDYMPADDVNSFANMVQLLGDQIVAGVSGEALVAAFAEAFPAVEREPLQPFFSTPEPAPPPMQEPVAVEHGGRRRWWQGKGEESPPMTPPSNPANLIAAYESQRRGAPAGSGASTPLPPAPAGPLPSLPEQPSMYEVSRSLRLVLEAPRKLARGLRRASSAVGGASELVNGLQDPRVRRNAMRGLYAAAAHQEAEGGPLAPVAPVVRAAVRFAEPVDEPQAEQQQTRRIAVKAAVRTSDGPRQVPVEGREPAGRSEEPAERKQAPTEPLRRSVSVRRVEPPAEPPVAAAPAEPRPAPVRRIAVTRPERVAPVEPHVVALNGHGRHED